MNSKLEHMTTWLKQKCSKHVFNNVVLYPVQNTPKTYILTSPAEDKNEASGKRITFLVEQQHLSLAVGALCKGFYTKHCNWQLTPAAFSPLLYGMATEQGKPANTKKCSVEKPLNTLLEKSSNFF